MSLSKFVSYFFHPINFPIFGTILYFIFIPSHIFKQLEHQILIVVFSGTYIFPMFLLFLLKRFKMIESYHMVSIEERKFPTLLFISIMFIVGNWLYKSTLVDILSLFLFGYGIGLMFSYLLLFFRYKISLHTAAVGGLIGFIIYFSYYFKVNMIIVLSLLFLLSGIIASARLRLHAHKLNEVILGYLFGIITQFIAYAIYIM